MLLSPPTLGDFGRFYLLSPNSLLDSGTQAVVGPTHFTPSIGSVVRTSRDIAQVSASNSIVRNEPIKYGRYDLERAFQVIGGTQSQSQSHIAIATMKKVHCDPAPSLDNHRFDKVGWRGRSVQILSPCSSWIPNQSMAASPGMSARSGSTVTSSALRVASRKKRY